MHDMELRRRTVELAAELGFAFGTRTAAGQRLNRAIEDLLVAMDAAYREEPGVEPPQNAFWPPPPDRG